MLVYRQQTNEAAFMRLKNLYGPHRLAMVGGALLVLSLAVFTLTAAFAHIRARVATGQAVPRFLGQVAGDSPLDQTWRVDEGRWSVDQTGYTAGPGSSSLVAEAPGRDFRLSFSLKGGSPEMLPDVVVRERDAGTRYILSAASDGRLSLARSADGTPTVVATSPVLPNARESDTAFVVEANGGRLRAWWNGLLAIDFVDPDPLQDGQVRIQSQAGNLRLSHLSLQVLPP
jgi:hypothetical protein